MRDIIASGGGINWCWYHWITIDEEARVATETRADRFHRFDETQGANEHPKADCSFEVYHRPKDDADFRATWGSVRVDGWLADWTHNLAKWELPPDTKTVVVLQNIGTFALVSLPR